jgi:hypothetical protein
MSKKRRTPEDTIGNLRHADVLLGQVREVAEIVEALGITGVPDSRGREEFGGTTIAQAKRLEEVERESG